MKSASAFPRWEKEEGRAHSLNLQLSEKKRKRTEPTKKRGRLRIRGREGRERHEGIASLGSSTHKKERLLPRVQYVQPSRVPDLYVLGLDDIIKAIQFLR